MSISSFRIGDFTLDLTRLCLIGPDGPIGLRPKTFEALKYFAEHPERVIGKEELLKAIWPGVNVTYDSLTQCISEARRVMGSNGKDLIKTIPRRGYLLPAIRPVPVGAPEQLLPDWSTWDPSVLGRVDLLRFARAHRLAVVATISSAGQPQASVVRFVATDSFELIIDSLGTARKVSNLRSNSNVGLTIGWDDLQTLQIDGHGKVENGDDLERAKALYASQFPGALSSTPGHPGSRLCSDNSDLDAVSDFRRNPAEACSHSIL